MRLEWKMSQSVASKEISKAMAALMDNPD